ncbi:hypothetical protein [Plantibacter flavus]|uniref:hypothetical protein n=1 Tax=Plantibacter flavus TaxID=150123 RepID=UPI00399C12B4
MGRTLATLPAQEAALPALVEGVLDVDDPAEDDPLVAPDGELDDPSEDFEEAGIELEPLPAPARESVR